MCRGDKQHLRPKLLFADVTCARWWELTSQNAHDSRGKHEVLLTSGLDTCLTHRTMVASGVRIAGVMTGGGASALRAATRNSFVIVRRRTAGVRMAQGGAFSVLSEHTSECRQCSASENAHAVSRHGSLRVPTKQAPSIR